MVCEECGKSFQQRGSFINHLAKHHSKSVKSEAKHAAREFKDKIKKERKGSLAETEIGIEHVELPSSGLTCPLVKEEMDDSENKLEMQEELEEGEVRLEEQEVVDAIPEIPIKVMPELTLVVMDEIRIKKEEDTVVLNEMGRDRANFFGFDEYLNDDNDSLLKAEGV